MKNGTCIFFILLAFGNIWAQATIRGTENATGANPLKLVDRGITRALVIGVSDYIDEDIADLRYAHRDAQVFADYLLAANGAALPKENLKLLLNEEATLAAIDIGLDWLLHETKKGDKAIIYFSGHGDVEKQTPWQRGFLLAHDTPYPNLRNNATRVEDLDEIVKTLSVSKEAKVIVILDACRAGKLANTGPSLTAEQLEKQVENEVRILSCKPDQKSIEGENWGQGRGLFSFFLVNGLSGLADSGSFPDQIITLDELTGFVKNGMQQALSDPSFSNRQNPVFVGDENYEVAEVNEELFAQVNGNDMVAMASPAMKGVLEKGSDSVEVKVFIADFPLNEDDRLMQFADFSLFDDFVVDSTFPAILALQQPDTLLNFFIKKISGDVLAESEDENEKQALLQAATDAQQSPSQRQRLQLLLATELHDQAQTAINDYLRGDPGSLDKRYFKDQAEKYVMYPRMMQAALVLLPKDHLLRKKTEVKLHYFDGVCSRLAGQMSTDPQTHFVEAFAKQKKALALDDKAAYIHNELGLLYLGANELDSALHQFRIAAELAPNWAMPQTNLCAVFIEKVQLDSAQVHGETAVALQPDYFGAHLNLGVVAEKKHDLLTAETRYRKARELNDPHYLPFERRAFLQLESTRYHEADWQFYEMELRKRGIVAPLTVDAVVATPLFLYNPAFEYPSLSGPGVIHSNPKTVKELFMTGKAYFEQKDHATAEPFFKKAMKLEPNHREVYFYLGTICANQERFEEAEVYLKRLSTLRPEVEFMPVFLGEVYKKWGRLEDAERIYRDFLPKSESQQLLISAYQSLAWILGQQERYTEQELLLWDFYKFDKGFGTNELVVFYHNMITKFPNNSDWYYRFADFEYQVICHLSGIIEFKNLYELDSNYSAIGHALALIGRYYLNEAAQPILNESLSDWEKDNPSAIHYLELSVQKAPNIHAVKYDLAAANLKVFRYQKALAVLDSLRKNGGLDFPNRLVLADLLLRSGRFEEAKAHLDKAWDMQPEALHRLPEITGKWHQLHGETENAIGFYEQELPFAEGKAKANLCYTLARLNAQKGKQVAALEWLRQAGVNGFDCPLVMKYDPAMASVKHTIAFVDLYKKIAAAKSYDKADR